MSNLTKGQGLEPPESLFLHVPVKFHVMSRFSTEKKKKGTEPQIPTNLSNIAQNQSISNHSICTVNVTKMLMNLNIIEAYTHAVQDFFLSMPLTEHF